LALFIFTQRGDHPALRIYHFNPPRAHCGRPNPNLLWTSLNTARNKHTQSNHAYQQAELADAEYHQPCLQAADLPKQRFYFPCGLNQTAVFAFHRSLVQENPSTTSNCFFSALEQLNSEEISTLLGGNIRALHSRTVLEFHPRLRFGVKKLREVAIIKKW
jgi:hypothetical protein